MTVSGFWHGGLTVAETERSLAFYVDLLGLVKLTDRVTRQKSLLSVVGVPAGGLRVCMLQVPQVEVYVELVEYLDCPTPPTRAEVSSAGTGHLCFYTEDLRGLWERLREAGVESISPGPVDCSERIPGTWCMYVRDPDGYPVELFEGPRYPIGRGAADGASAK